MYECFAGSLPYGGRSWAPHRSTITTEPEPVAQRAAKAAAAADRPADIIMPLHAEETRTSAIARWTSWSTALIGSSRHRGPLHV